ncbi:MAG: isochorismate synthase [Actinomycetota bacterium]|nr:isochorismate synthase [Actinomycetota bacterium]
MSNPLPPGARRIEDLVVTPTTRLVATTVRARDDVDLLSVAGSAGVVFARGDHGLAGRGQALRLDLPSGAGRLAAAADQVHAALATIERRDEVGLPGCGPVAFAALPFSDDVPASVVVPRVAVGRTDDGTRWITTVDPVGAASLAPLAPASEATPLPTSFRVTASRTPSAWCEAVAQAVVALRAGSAAKVVLAREVVVEADAPFDPITILRRLAASAPSASMVYAVDGLIGASPELLVSRIGDIVRSHPMAGTTARTGDPSVDARLAATLLASAKDRAEHQITIDTVLDTVLPFCSFVDSEPEPSIAAAGNVQHLASLVEGRLSSPPVSVLALVAALHPTPAVCGWPRAAARTLIERLEDLDRGRYAGAVGWVDADGNGRFAVAIRGVELDGCRARILAGNGIMADSDPATELDETRAKLQAVLAAVVRP